MIVAAADDDGGCDDDDGDCDDGDGDGMTIMMIMLI